MSTNTYVEQCDYLYCNADNHDKVYNVAIRLKGSSNWEVVAEYGARTSVLKLITKYTGPSLTQARIIYADLISEKLNKKYKRVNTDKSGRSNLTTVPVSGNNKTPAQIKKDVEDKIKREKEKAEAKKSNENYNPDAIPERRLDFDDL